MKQVSYTQNLTAYESLALIEYTVKPVLNGHSKIDKTKILMTYVA